MCPRILHGCKNDRDHQGLVRELGGRNSAKVREDGFARSDHIESIVLRPPQPDNAQSAMMGYKHEGHSRHIAQI